jgi:predicted nucleic acid-binding protein
VKRFVIDASVAIRWLPLFKNEPLVSQARQYLGRRSAGEITVIVPDLFWAEVSGVLWKAARRGSCDADEASVALSTLQEEKLPTVPSLLLVNSALSIAMKYGRSLYDCLYVTLAVRSDAQLVTADEKLANALAAHFPVRWLGSF